MAFKVEDKGYTFKTKNLGGETLAELDAERKKRGVVDPNDTSTKFFAAADVEIKANTGDTVWFPGTMQFVNHKVHAWAKYEKPTVSVRTVIEIVKPAKLSKMSKDEQKEWKRFEAALRKHEIEHHKKGLDLAQVILREIVEATTEVVTDDISKKNMMNQAMIGLNWEVGRTVGNVKDRCNAAMKALDKATNHGGVVLKYQK